MKTLEEHNIESRPVWKPLHLQPVFEKYGFYTGSEDRPFSERAFEMGLCLPSGSSLNTKGTGQGYLLDKGKITGPMNILFATIAFPENIEQHNIYTDLMEELRDQGHDFLCCLSL